MAVIVTIQFRINIKVTAGDDQAVDQVQVSPGVIRLVGQDDR